MSALVDVSRQHGLGHSMLDPMARPTNSWPEPYPPRSQYPSDHYGPQRQEPYQQSSQPPPPPPPERYSQDGSQPFKLPGPSSMLSGSPHCGSPHGEQHLATPPLMRQQLNLKTHLPHSHYHDGYATPSPIQPSPVQHPSPQLPLPTSEPSHHRRPMPEAPLSPTQSSTASGSSVEPPSRSFDRTRALMGIRELERPGSAESGLPSYGHTRDEKAPSRLAHQSPHSSETYRDHSPPNMPSSYPPHGASSLNHSTQPPMSPPERQWSPKSNEADSAGNRVKIADLLTSSAEDGSTAGAMSSKSASKTPVPFPRVPTIPTSEYSITVRQQPFAARSCGFGERDRRVIDPPPIVQLHVKMPGASDEEIKQKLRHPYSVVHCSIWNETGTVDYSAMPEDYRQQRRLMGTLVASPFVGVDENGEEGCFFCFPDLSCRTPGAFRLRFVLVVLDPATARPGSMNQIMSVAMSDVFTVFNAKDFPGMQASTALTKKLKEQGCLISIKKGNEKNGKGERESDDDDDEESRPRKKSKKA